MLLKCIVNTRFCQPRRFLSYDRVNQSELNKFSVIGNDWWDPSSKAGTGPLHDLNPVRVGYVRSGVAEALKRQNVFATQQLKGLKILDVGCGGGLLSESLARLGAHMTSIDPSPENIQVASTHSKLDPITANIDYRQSTIEEVLASGEKFDVVCALEVIEHVDDPKGFIQACAQCVGGTEEGPGSLFVSTMNRTKKAHLMAILGAEYVLGMIPPGTHEWEKFITPEELCGMVESTPLDSGGNMKMINQNGIVLKPRNPFKNKMNLNCSPIEWGLSPTDIDVNYIAHFVKMKPSL
eukprot:CAMPEP_0170382206 /NCGR_PEP_ID=MMETSP0117_2-20130122/14820_1 /TAXON_ID=400756 /ORGANISM="Durinskia baltica, Strain CSIRO CS-38" /LENGTH=293 /DNA_ID=CAMNT_0010637831 /DNA_START=57 /DNA_END=938 /DNA_ORIENTATION=+